MPNHILDAERFKKVEFEEESKEATEVGNELEFADWDLFNFESNREANYKTELGHVLDNHIYPAYKAEEEFVKFWRWFLTLFIVSIIVIEIFAVLVMVYFDYKGNISIDYKYFSQIVIAFFIQMIGLLTIIFRYLFNKRDNKVLEIIEKSISALGTFERKD